MFEKLQKAGVLSSELYDLGDDDVESFYEVQSPYYLLHTNSFSGETTFLSGMRPSGKVITDYNPHFSDSVNFGDVDLLLNVQRSSDLKDVLDYLLGSEFDSYLEEVLLYGYEFEGVPDINSGLFLQSIEDDRIEHIYKTAFKLKRLIKFGD